MKKVISLLIVIVIGGTAISQRAVEIGIKAGISAVNLKAQFQEELDNPRAGFNVGMFANVPVCNRFAIQPEVVFSKQGNRYGKAYEDKLSYVNVPVLVQYKFKNGFRLQTGPQLGVAVSSMRKVLDPSILVIAEDFKTFDASWAMGMAYVGRKGWGVDARYNYGFTNINKAGPLSLKNRVWQIGFTYRLTRIALAR